MDYQKHYDKLVERGRHRKLVGYSENHHVIPVCMGGTNDKSNLIRLTPEEHYVAHQLLVCIYPKNHKLLWAAVAMTNKTKLQQRQNKLYGWLKREFSVYLTNRNTGSKWSESHRKAFIAARTGIKTQPHSDATKKKMSLASKGKKKSAAHIKSLVLVKTGIKLKPHSDAAKEKISKSNILTKNSGIKLNGEKWETAYLSDPAYKLQQSNKMREIWELRKKGVLQSPNHKKYNKLKQ